MKSIGGVLWAAPPQIGACQAAGQRKHDEFPSRRFGGGQWVWGQFEATAFVHLPPLLI